MRKVRYKVFAVGSASHRLQRCLCVTETEGEEPLAFRIKSKRHAVGTENPVIADLPVGADTRGQRTANVSEGRKARLDESPREGPESAAIRASKPLPLVHIASWSD
jgi:hypothetical protein